MIGLDIEVKNGYNNYLKIILNGIEFSNYEWEIIYEDFMLPANQEVKIFDSNIMDGDLFYNCIASNSYYMIFADIKAYPAGCERDDIETFEDFINSNCEIVLICTDCTFIEFYCKDRDVLDKVYQNCI